MSGRRRSGLAAYRRAYGCACAVIPTPRPTYTVTYNGNANTGGSVPVDSSSPYEVGSSVTIAGNSGSLVRTFYVFAGWNTAANGSGTPYAQGGSFFIDADVVLYAQWTPVLYTVVYNSNTATGGAVPTDSSSPYLAGSSVTVAGNTGSLAKTDYTFAGWNTAANGSGTPYAQGGSFSIGADVVLYAQWTPVLYTVVYNSNTATGGAVPTDSSSPYLAGSSVTVAGNTGSLAKTGYTFAGWNTAANGTGTSYVQGNTFTINANTVLYAMWTAVVAPSVATPTALSSVGGDRAAYILFTQTGTVTNYEYSTDDGATFVAFNPAQTFSPVLITALSSDATALTNGVTYTVKLKAVNGASSSTESVSVDVIPATNTLLATNRLIHLDANNSSSYSGTGTAWTNLDSGGLYSATLLNGPSFDNTNKWFTFDGNNQIAQIAAAAALNPTTPFGAFTAQIWARVDTESANFGSNDGLISKQYGWPSYDGYSLSLSNSGAVVLNMNGSGVNGNSASEAGVYSNGWALYTIVVRFGGGSSNPSYSYVSGRRVVTANNGEFGMPSPNAPLQFPRGIQDEPWNYCPADVGAFYLYNAALSQEDIIRNFDATKTRYSL